MTTMAEVSPDDFKNYLLGVRSQNTAETYHRGAIRFEKYLEKRGLSFSTLNSGILSDFASYLTREEKLKPATVQLMTISASRYLKWRKRSGDTIPDIYDAELPVVRYPDPKAMTAEELISFMKTVYETQKEPYRTAMLILPFCGLRSMEIVKLRTNDVVTKSDPSGKKVIFTVEGKGGKIREVPLMKKGRRILGIYLSGWRANLPGNYLFPKKNGDPIAKRTLRKKFQWVRNSTGIDGLRAHKCRRTWSTALGEMGISDIDIARLMGHSSVDTLMRHYKETSVDGVARKIG